VPFAGAVLAFGDNAGEGHGSGGLCYTFWQNYAQFLAVRGYSSMGIHFMRGCTYVCLYICVVIVMCGYTF